MSVPLIHPSGLATGLWEYDEMAVIAARRFGTNSQAVVFVLYDELVRVRTLLATDPHRDLYLQSRIAALRHQIQHLYDSSGYLNAGPAPHARPVAGRPTLIEYDRAVFDSRYASAVEGVRPELVHVATRSLGPLRSGRCYMYVIDQDQRLIVWNRVFTFTDLTLGRNRPTVHGVPVAHPLLVPDTLSVCAAGEFIPITGSEPESTLRSAIVNTKSGHFRPPAACSPLVRATFEKIGLDRPDIDVFTLDPRAGSVG